MVKRLFILVALFILNVHGLDAQILVATTQARQVVEGTSFTVKFELKGGRSGDFTAPDFRGFRRISGPNTSSSTTIINGKMTTSYALTYTLLAPKKGKYTIGSGTMNVKGKLIKSQPLSVEVLEAKEVEGGIQYFVKAELEKDTGYVGQQMRLHLKLYSKVDIERYDVVSQPEYGDIYVEEIPIFKREAKIEVVEGVQYSTQILRSLALFPQKSGKYNLDGYVLRLGLPDPTQRRSGGFFFTSRLKMVDVQTEGVKLEILPLPDPKPISFSGGVGAYKVSMKTDRTKLSTDDALSLILTVRGDGDPRMLSAPKLNLSDDFESYDANEIANNSNNDVQKTFTKKFEYLVIPKRAGQLELLPEFSYFRPDSQSYVTVVTGKQRLYVSKGNSESKALEKFKKDQALDLAPLMNKSGVVKPANPWIFSGLYWSLLGMCGLAFCGLIYMRRVQLIEDGLDPEIRKRKAARKKAERRLSVAKELMSSEGTSFFEELALGIKQYLGDKLSVDPAYFTRRTIGSELNKNSITQDRIDQVDVVLSECDLALFAGSGKIDRESLYERAVELVIGLEGEL